MVHSSSASTVVIGLTALFLAHIAQAQTNTAPVEKPVSELAASVPLVMLTYPATITPAAESKLNSSYARLKWPTSCGGFMNACSENRSAIDQALVRTAYYIPSVYAALVAGLPRGSVVVQPATLDVGSNGQFIYRSGDPDVPAAVKLDFVAFVAPRFSPSAPGATTYTYGREVLPVFLATAAPTANASGVYAATRGIGGGAVINPPSALAAIADTTDTKNRSTPLLSFDAKGLKFSDAEWAMLDTNNGAHAADAMMARELQPFITTVRSIDREAVAKQALPEYASLYGNALVRAGPQGAPMIPRFLAAEVKFNNQLVEQGFVGLGSGEFGKSVRKMMMAEREQDKKANRTAWIGALTMMAGGLGSLASTGVALTPQLLMSMAQQQTALQQSSSAFNQSASNAASVQRSVVIQFGSKEETVTARSIAELRQHFSDRLVAISQPASKASRPIRNHKRTP